METDKIGDVVTIYRRYRFPHYTFIEGRDCTNSIGASLILTAIVLAVISVIELKL